MRIAWGVVGINRPFDPSKPTQPLAVAPLLPLTGCGQAQQVKPFTLRGCCCLRWTAIPTIDVLAASWLSMKSSVRSIAVHSMRSTDRHQPIGLGHTCVIPNVKKILTTHPHNHATHTQANGDSDPLGSRRLPRLRTARSQKKTAAEFRPGSGRRHVVPPPAAGPGLAPRGAASAQPPFLGIDNIVTAPATTDAQGGCGVMPGYAHWLWDGCCSTSLLPLPHPHPHIQSINQPGAEHGGRHRGAGVRWVSNRDSRLAR